MSKRKELMQVLTSLEELSSLSRRLDSVGEVEVVKEYVQAKNIKPPVAYQHLFEALQNVCGFVALQGDMIEIVKAVEKDKEEQIAYYKLTFGK